MEAIDVVRPRILVCEFNNAFGGTRAVTVPYRPDFVRQKAHHSLLYFGASLKAIATLAGRKGYDLVGTNSQVMNAFFVRKDLSAPFAKYAPEEVFRPAKFRESRDMHGKRNYLSGADRLEEIKSLPIFDLETQVCSQIREVYSLEMTEAAAAKHAHLL